MKQAAHRGDERNRPHVPEVVLEVLDRHLGLPLEHGVNETRASGRADVPLLDVADSARALESDARHERDVAERQPAEAAEQRTVRRRPQPLGQRSIVPQFAAVDERELLGVVRRVQARLVDRLLADDRVEEVAAGWHQCARRDAPVVFRPLTKLAAQLVGRIEVQRHEHWRAVGQRPWLERRLREPEHRARSVQADGVHAQRARKVRRDLAEHLVGLDDLHGRAGRVEPKALAQLVDDADVDAGLEAAAKIHWQVIRLGVGTGGRDALARRHRVFRCATDRDSGSSHPRPRVLSEAFPSVLG
jgi:hypothetical protein